MEKITIDYENKNIPSDARIHEISFEELEAYTVNTEFFLVSNIFINSFIQNQQRYYLFSNLSSGKKIVGKVKSSPPFFPRWQHKDILIGALTLGDVLNMEIWEILI